VARDRSGPRPLSWSLEQVASRVKRVDLVGLAAVSELWPTIEAARRSEARPVKVVGAELVVAVPSGAHATRARRDAPAILAALALALSSAPTSLRVTVHPEDAARR